jgi:putative membrane protein
LSGSLPRGETEFRVLIGATLAALAFSATGPSDRTTWILESVPVIIGIPWLVIMRHRFPLTPMLTRLLFLHALVLLVGAYYTYAKVPAGFWFADLFDLTRNHYDRFGHIVQGAVPAILAREILLRKTPLRPGGWLFVLVSCVCLAFSAFYEFTEWWSAVIGGDSTDAFLGAQGDIWDTQWDMLMALIGSILSQLVFARAHDRALASLRRDASLTRS